MELEGRAEKQHSIWDSGSDFRAIFFLMVEHKRLLFKHGGLLPASAFRDAIVLVYSIILFCTPKVQSPSTCCAIFGSGLEERKDE
jgi:hypothetical protein